VRPWSVADDVKGTESKVTTLTERSDYSMVALDGRVESPLAYARGGLRMNRPSVAVLSCCISLFATPHAFAQNVTQPQAIASSDVLSQISMFSYREGPKSDLNFRGTPIAASAYGAGEVEYDNGKARISVEIEDLPEPASLGPYTTYFGH
jgi:hypothetical protein